MAAVAAVLTSTAPLCASANGPQIGKPAPPLNLARIIHAAAGVRADWQALRGRVAVIDFWATWCGPCRKSIPHWNGLADAFQGKPVVFIAITDENPQVVAAFLSRNPIRSWIGFGATRQVYGIEGIPTTVIVNQKGIVVAVRHPMLIRPKDIQEVIDTGTSSLPPEVASPLTRTGDRNGMEPVRSPKPVFEVSVRPSGPLPRGHGFNCWSSSATNADLTGQYATVKSAILAFFDESEVLLDCRTSLPTNQYDFTVRLPTRSHTERERAVAPMLREVFGLKVRRVRAEREVYVLKVASTNAPGLSLSTPRSSGLGSSRPGGLTLGSTTLDGLPGWLEGYLRKPVINETGLTNRYDLRLNWEMSKSELLPLTFDRRVLQAGEDPDSKNEAKLSAYQRRELAATRGKIPPAQLKNISPQDRENIRLLRAELAKPKDEQFMPEPQSIIKAVRDQLGLALVLERRPVSVLVVNKARR